MYSEIEAWTPLDQMISETAAWTPPEHLVWKMTLEWTPPV
jgi:hypothetical protein